MIINKIIIIGGLGVLFITLSPFLVFKIKNHKEKLDQKEIMNNQKEILSLENQKEIMDNQKEILSKLENQEVLNQFDNILNIAFAALLIIGVSALFVLYSNRASVKTVQEASNMVQEASDMTKAQKHINITDKHTLDDAIQGTIKVAENHRDLVRENARLNGELTEAKTQSFETIREITTKTNNSQEVIKDGLDKVYNNELHIFNLIDRTNQKIVKIMKILSKIGQ